MNHSPAIQVPNVFSHSVRYYILLFIVSFDTEKVFISGQWDLAVCLLLFFCTSVVIPKKSLPNPKQSFLLCFLRVLWFWIFNLLRATFLNGVKIFYCCTKCGLNILLHLDCQFSWQPLLKGHSNSFIVVIFSVHFLENRGN